MGANAKTQTVVPLDNGTLPGKPYYSIEQTTTNSSSELENFENFARKLIAVPKQEIDEKNPELARN